jgi:hypothetical protein
MSDDETKREPVRPPMTDEEWRAWDAYAAAAVTGWLWWQSSKPVVADAPAIDAAKIADELLELRRARKRAAR